MESRFSPPLPRRILAQGESLIRYRCLLRSSPTRCSTLRQDDYLKIQDCTTETFDLPPCGLTRNSLTICRTVQPSAYNSRARATRLLCRYCLQVCEQVSRLARLTPGARRKNLWQYAHSLNGQTP